MISFKIKLMENIYIPWSHMSNFLFTWKSFEIEYQHELELIKNWRKVEFIKFEKSKFWKPQFFSTETITY